MKTWLRKLGSALRVLANPALVALLPRKWQAPAAVVGAVADAVTPDPQLQPEAPAAPPDQELAP